MCLGPKPCNDSDLTPAHGHKLYVCRHMLAMVEKAINGMYRAASYTPKDRDLGFIALKVGGRQLLHTFQVTSGLPSASTVDRNWHKKPKCAGLPSLYHQPSSLVLAYKFSSYWVVICQLMFSLVRRQDAAAGEPVSSQCP